MNKYRGNVVDQGTVNITPKITGYREVKTQYRGQEHIKLVPIFEQPTSHQAKQIPALPKKTLWEKMEPAFEKLEQSNIYITLSFVSKINYKGRQYSIFKSENERTFLSCQSISGEQKEYMAYISPAKVTVISDIYDGLCRVVTFDKFTNK